MDEAENRLGLEAKVRGAFITLVNERLPAAARAGGWAVAAPEGFERLLLDHALGAPWESALPYPSLGTASLLDLIVAVEMGERLLDGSASIDRLDRRSRAARAARAQMCAGPPEPDPCAQAVGALITRARAARPQTARLG